MSENKCKMCFGYGYWAWGRVAPMGSIDAKDGFPTLPCPECGANPNPIRGDHGEIIKNRAELALKYKDD